MNKEVAQSVLNFVLLFFGSFALFSFSLVQAFGEFSRNQLIYFLLIIAIGLILLSVTLYKIFKKNKIAFFFG
tara:strand:- start:53 stop:268 length:216 start_codon:yes stop_codon:yes gene_type:complete